MRARIIIAAPKPFGATITDAFEIFYDKVWNVKDYKEGCERVIKLWNSDAKLREKVRTYMYRYYPLSTHITAHVGTGTNFVNPFRMNSVSIPFNANKIAFNLYHTQVLEVE